MSLTEFRVVNLRSRGFTLVELLIAVAIIAILAAAAIPFYNNYTVRTYRSEGQGDLLMCALGMERHMSVNFTYANSVDTDSDNIGDTNTGTVSPNVCTPLSTRYVIAVTAATAAGYTLRATPSAGTVVATDGVIEVDASGLRRWDRNDDNDFGDTDETTWDL